MRFERYGSGANSLRYAFLPDGVVLRTRLASVKGDLITAGLVRLLLSGDPAQCSPDELAGVRALAEELQRVGLSIESWSVAWQDRMGADAR